MAAADEQNDVNNPLLPDTTCIALYDFAGASPNDLPFKAGEKLVIIEPSKEIYWYLARNSKGKTGLVPVTYLEENKMDAPALPKKPPHLSPRRPPPPTPLFPYPHAQPCDPGSSSIPSSSPGLSPSPGHLPPIPGSKPPARIPDYLQISDDISNGLPPPPPPKPKTLSMKPATLPRSSNEVLPSHIVTPPFTPPTTIATNRNQDLPPEIDHRPPMPLPHEKNEKSDHTPGQSRHIQVGKYPTIHAFREQSGWFTPTPDFALCRKMTLSMQAFKGMSSAIYYFQHKYEETKHYVGKSNAAHTDLVTLFSRLYEKSEEKLNTLERELRFNSPDAKDWNVSIWACHFDNLDLEETKLIVQQRSLYPEGLNEQLNFTSRRHFNLFCEWYTDYRLKKQKK